MKGTKLKVAPLRGMRQQLPQEPTDATEIVNFTVDRETNGWDDRIGYERLFYDQETYEPFVDDPRCDWLYIWSRHQGAQQWFLYETNGTLSFVEDYSTTVAKRTIATNRSIPNANEAGTTATPFGRYLCILNGYDKPIKYGAWPAEANPQYLPIYDLGWHSLPAAPDVWQVDLTPATIDGGMMVGIKAGGGASRERGLGDATVDTFNKYLYKVSFINNAGSESPLSNPSSAISWTDATTDTWVTHMKIPRGPAGTVARRLYRTANLGDNITAETYYYVRDIANNWETDAYDHLSDLELGPQAPQLSDSVLFPSFSARYSTSFKGCLFIDGGVSNETTLFWSNAGLPDTFSALDYLDLGNTEGGAITGLYAYFNFMVVMRERSIYVVDGNYTEGFSAYPVGHSVGSRAVNAITGIPELGVVMLATDGVYALMWDAKGGGTVKFEKISTPLQSVFERINPDVIARATAAYSHKWREWHCYFAVDGSDRPNIGVVLHMDKMEWSVREGFPVGTMATDFNGDLFFGHVEGADSKIGTKATGVHVVSRRRTLKATYNPPAGQDPAYLTEDTPPTSRYRSAWLNFGDDDAKKKVRHVYLFCKTTGDNPVTMTYYKDHKYTGTAAPQMKMQRPDSADQFVLGKATTGDAVWENQALTQIRYPIADGSCSQFQFKVETTNDMILVGYAVEFTANGTAVISGKRV